MILAITILSIIAIAGAAWGINRASGIKVCPICAGVAGTWIWLVGAGALGYQIDIVLPAMLMGGSVVGIAYTAEKYLLPRRSPLLWKAAFIPIGFMGAYGVLAGQWSVALAATVGLVFAGLVFLRFSQKTSNVSEGARIEKLKRDMKDCC